MSLLSEEWVRYVIPGDRIRCIGKRQCSNPKTESKLTVGNEYEVTYVGRRRRGSHISVVNDNGKSSYYSTKWFAFTWPDNRIGLPWAEDTPYRPVPLDYTMHGEMADAIRYSLGYLGMDIATSYSAPPKQRDIPDPTAIAKRRIKA